MRTKAVAFLTLVGALVPAAARADGTPYQLEIGPGLAWVEHVAKTDGSGVTYDSYLAPGLLLRAWFVPWLRGSVRFMQGHVKPSFSAGALGVPGTLASNGTGLVESLSAQVHPTWSPAPRLHVWGTLGLGWAHVAMPTLDASDGAHLRGRAGIFANVPLGAGAGFDVLRWLTASLDLAWAPVFAPSGELFAPDVYYGVSGQPLNVAAFPSPKSSLSAIATVALAL